jgi:hypothetical protein
VKRVAFGGLFAFLEADEFAARALLASPVIDTLVSCGKWTSRAGRQPSALAAKPIPTA